MKMERLVKRNTEIETCCNNIKLLTEMLNHYSPSSPSQDKELMKVSGTCKFNVHTLYKWQMSFIMNNSSYISYYIYMISF